MNVLITGTSSGIGYALAREFLENGATVYGISCRLNKNLDKYACYHHLAHDLENHTGLPGKIHNFLCDIKTLDLVILNGGIKPDINDISKTSVDELAAVMNINVWANKVIIDTLLETMTGLYQVVAISSGSYISNIAGWNAYTVSKSMLNTLMKLYSEEVPDTHFSAIAPGVFYTELQESASDSFDYKDYPLARKLKNIKEKDQLTEPEYAANYLVEAMGLVLQKESGLFMDVKDILYPAGSNV